MKVYVLQTWENEVLAVFMEKPTSEQMIKGIMETRGAKSPVGEQYLSKWCRVMEMPLIMNV
jgi:hypothetical protein